MPLTYIDSNIFFYAKILDRDYGESSSQIIRDVAQGRIKAIVSNLVLLEVANALKKYGLASEVKDEVDAIFSLGIPILEVQNVDLHEAMVIFDRYRISPYDCVHIATMKRASSQTIITADKDFNKIRWIKRIDPKTRSW